jgi:hypothetical protein
MRGGRLVVMMVAVAVATLVPAAGRAQVAWDSPMLMPPGVGDGFGLYLADVEGGGLGVIGTWRSPGWNFGVRGGLAESRGDNLGVFAGFDVNGALTRSNNDFPLDVDWLFGAGLGVADGVRLSAPVGLSVGHTFNADDVTFTPFATPRVVLDAFLDDDDDEVDDDDDLDLELAVDLGLDLRFTRDFLVRFSGTLGDRNGVAIGLVF